MCSGKSTGFESFGRCTAAYQAMSRTSRWLDANVDTERPRDPSFVTQAAVPRLRNGGRIIAISSGTSKRPIGPTVAYCVAKADVYTPEPGRITDGPSARSHHDLIVGAA